MSTTIRMLSVIVMALSVPLPIAAQDSKEKPQEPVKPPTAEELNEFAKLAEPGSENKRLAALAGKWSLVMNMPSRREPKLVYKGEGEASAILGGRFVDVNFAIDVGPLKGENRYTLGFDRRHGEYTIIAADTTGTYFVTARGKPDATKPDEITMHGTDDDPIMKRMGLEKKFQFVLRFKGDDDFNVEVVFIDTRTKENKPMPFATFVFKRAEK